jgi:hypothetical protein
MLDSGTMQMAGDTGGTTTNDSGMPVGCGHNPNMCAMHELVGPSPNCQCLATCEQGWRWDPVSSTCVPDQGGNDGGVVVRPDTGPFDGGVPTSDPFDPATLAATYAQALCNFTTRCEPAIFAYTRSSEQECITENTQAIAENWQLVSAAIAAHRVGFSRSAFDRCIQAFQMTTDCARGVEPRACDGIFAGAHTENLPCQITTECAPGLFCGGVNVVGQCGYCQRRTPSGMDCSRSLCEVGNRCLDVAPQGQGPDYRCIPNTADENQPCGAIASGLCRGRLQCVGMAQNYMCRRPVAANGMCTPPPQMGVPTTAGCNIYQNHDCVMNRCTMVNWVGTGMSCVEPALCTYESYCDMDTCAGLPTSGQACFMGACGPDLFCNQQSQCSPFLTPGQACTSTNDCEGQLYCINGQCAALTYMQCN